MTPTLYPSTLDHFRTVLGAGNFGTLADLEAAEDRIVAKMLTMLPMMPQWPADAQLAVLRWAFTATEPVMPPKILTALTQRPPDFRAAASAVEWAVRDADTYLAMTQLFLNAADVVEHGLDPTSVVFPKAIVQDVNGNFAPSFGGEFDDADFGDDGSGAPAILPTVMTAFVSTLGGEGFTHWMYLDKRQLLTVGRGNLIDTSIAGATDPQHLSWVDGSGNAASPEEIAADIQAVKARPDLIPYGGAGLSPQGEGFSTVTHLRLTDDAIAGFVQQAAQSLASTLANYYPAIGSWPADAQLALLRWAWARGPNVPFLAPKMSGSLQAMDFASAAQEAHWQGEDPQTHAIIVQLFQNAAAVQAQGLDPTELQYPASLGSGAVAMNGDPLRGGSGAAAGSAGYGSQMGSGAMGLRPYGAPFADFGDEGASSLGNSPQPTRATPSPNTGDELVYWTKLLTVGILAGLAVSALSKRL
jgi:hypothetical protein